MSQNIFKKFKQLADEFPQKEPISFDLDHIPLPNLHPDPNISIQLTQHIIKLAELDQPFDYFITTFEDLDDEGKYFLAKYFFEYWNDSNYDTYIKEQIKDKTSGPSSITWDVKNETYSQWKSKNFENPVENYRLSLQRLFKIYEFLMIRFSFLTVRVRRLYQHKLKHIDSKYLDDLSIFNPRDINSRVFRVDISRNAEEYVFKVRESFPTKFDNLGIDSFISNSFSFPSNNSKIELLSLTFGNRNETNMAFYKLYQLHKEIVKSPKVAKLDFARLMFINIKSIRDNFIKNSVDSTNLENLVPYLKRSVARNIRPDAPIRA